MHIRQMSERGPLLAFGAPGYRRGIVEVSLGVSLGAQSSNQIISPTLSHEGADGIIWKEFLPGGKRPGLTLNPVPCLNLKPTP